MRKTLRVPGETLRRRIEQERWRSLSGFRPRRTGAVHVRLGPGDHSGGHETVPLG
jgi:hypothetical protein